MRSFLFMLVACSFLFSCGKKCSVCKAVNRDDEIEICGRGKQYEHDLSVAAARAYVCTEVK